MLVHAAKTRTNVILFPRINLIRGDDAMKINCTECGEKSFIHSSKRLHAKMSQLYCTCSNPHCGHTFVMDLCFSHTLSPSAQQAKDVVVSFLRALPDAERQLMLANL
jgi:hypothetical protein